MVIAASYPNPSLILNATPQPRTDTGVGSGTNSIAPSESGELTQPLLTPKQWGKWLLSIGYLRGAILTPNNGPIILPRQVAVPKRVDAPYITPSRRELLSDEYAHTESDARHYHAGWPKPSDITGRPWSVLNQSDDTLSSSLWASRHLISTHFAINMSAQDLDPTEEFVQAISQALVVQSIAGKAAAMREVLNTWGEVIPLVVEVGISLAATGTVSSGTNLPSGPIISRSSSSQDLPWSVDATLGVKNVFQRRLASHTQGGDPQALQNGGYSSWLQSASTSIAQDSGNLAIVKVIRAIPIIDILDEHHQTQIRNLYSATSLFSHSASVGPTAGTSFGDLAANPRIIRSIRAWFTDDYVEGILITYENNVTAGPYGKCQGTRFDDFLVGQGEYVTDLFVWADSQRIRGLRFVKNTGQMSSHFGNRAAEDKSDPPQLFNNTGVLAGLTGSYDTAGITRLRAVWRNDIEIKNHWPTHTSFAGSRLGRVFNDLEYIGDPYTARLSRITLRDGGLGAVVIFQTRYIWNGPSGVVGAETGARGADGAGQRRVSFELDENEFIVQVMGTHDAEGIRQIQFKTNKRTSPLFGETNPFPVAFDLMAPPGMRLHYLAGKSHGWLASLLFVWAPIPDF